MMIARADEPPKLLKPGGQELAKFEAHGIGLAIGHAHNGHTILVCKLDHGLKPR